MVRGSSDSDFRELGPDFRKPCVTTAPIVTEQLLGLWISSVAAFKTHYTSSPTLSKPFLNEVSLQCLLSKLINPEPPRSLRPGAVLASHAPPEVFPLKVIFVGGYNN